MIENYDLGDIIKPLIRDIHLFDTWIAGTTHCNDKSIAILPGNKQDHLCRSPSQTKADTEWRRQGMGKKHEGDIYLIMSAHRADMLLLGGSGGRSSASSIDATAHRADRLFRMTSAPMRFPPLAVIGASPL